MITMSIPENIDVRAKAIAVDLRKAVDGYAGAFRAAVYLLGTEIITKAMRRCPVDTGYLRASRYVSKPNVSGYLFDMETGFGAPYAAHVHDVNARHRVGEWQFLRKAFDEMRPRAQTFLAGTVDRLVAGGITIDNVPEVHPVMPLMGPHDTRGLAARRARRQKRERASAKARRPIFKTENWG